MLTTVEAYELRSRRLVYGLFDAFAMAKSLDFSAFFYCNMKKLRRKSSCFLQEKQAQNLRAISLFEAL
jgi:hypothetical protein